MAIRSLDYLISSLIAGGLIGLALINSADQVRLALLLLTLATVLAGLLAAILSMLKPVAIWLALSCITALAGWQMIASSLKLPCPWESLALITGAAIALDVWAVSQSNYQGLQQSGQLDRRLSMIRTTAAAFSLRGLVCCTSYQGKREREVEWVLLTHQRIPAIVRRLI
jgi:hypothetical protein